MIKHFLIFSLAIPLSGYCQSYGDTPTFRRVSDVPSTARTEGYEAWRMAGLPVEVDLSRWMDWSSPDRHDGDGRVQPWVDRNKPDHVLHYYVQHDSLKVVYAFDLKVEPVQGTDEIRCTFSTFTDPDELPERAWRRDKSFPIVPLPGDLVPIVIKSGEAVAITTLPLGKGHAPTVHYIRLTRTNLASASTQQSLALYGV